jgi:hypothetical protein
VAAACCIAASFPTVVAYTVPPTSLVPIPLLVPSSRSPFHAFDRTNGGSFQRFGSGGSTFLFSADGGEPRNVHGEVEAGGDGVPVVAVAEDSGGAASPSVINGGAFATAAPPDSKNNNNNSNSNSNSNSNNNNNNNNNKNNNGMFVSLPSGNPFLAIPVELGFVLAPIIFCGLIYLGSNSGGLGVDKARTFSDWGGVVALYFAFASYIGEVMLYVMAEKAADVAARNRKENQEREDALRKERKEEREEDKKDARHWRRMEREWEDHLRRMDRLERLGYIVEDSIFRLHLMRLSTWWPWDKRAIDQRISAQEARLADLQSQHDEVKRSLEEFYVKVGWKA